MTLKVTPEQLDRLKAEWPGKINQPKPNIIHVPDPEICECGECSHTAYQCRKQGCICCTEKTP